MAPLAPEHTPRTYGNWRRPTSAGLFGLGSLGTYALIGGLIVVVLTVFVAGFLAALVVLALIAVATVLVATRDSHGKNFIQRASVRVSWWFTRSRGAHLYRSGPLGRTAWGTCQLPGIAAPLRLSEHRDSYNRPFALVYSPASGSYSIVIESSPDGASLVDPDQVDSWVAKFGHWLGTIGDEPGLDAASITVETAPESGVRLRREIELNIDPDAPAFAQQVLREVAEAYPAGASTVKAYIALTYAAALRGGKKRTPEQVGHDLSTRLPGLTGEMLSSTGAGAIRPLAAQELCELIRTAYDPAAATLIEEARMLGEAPDLPWSDVGPAAAQAHWSGYHHDSGYSQTWEMTQAPRGIVQAEVLARLLAPHREIDRKRVTLIYRPLDAAKAAALVEADLRAAEFISTTNAKPKARDVVAVRSARATASEEASGAGLINFAMLVTATVFDADRKTDAASAIDNIGATARLKLRPVYGGQDSAFAACLPLGLVLPKLLKVPADIREKL
jgi:hypothetical protein